MRCRTKDAEQVMVQSICPQKGEEVGLFILMTVTLNKYSAFNGCILSLALSSVHSMPIFACSWY